jgi:uncharacterized protein YggU (UPF0235/DUF167 family)
LPGRSADAPAARLKVRLTPGGGFDRIEDVVDGVLRVRVAARPVDGTANEALMRLLAAAVGIPRGRIAIVRGATARSKLVELIGITPKALRSRWPGVEV